MNNKGERTKGFIKKVEEIKSSNNKMSIKLVVFQEDVMLGGEVSYSVQLLSSESENKSDYDTNKLSKIFNQLNKNGLNLEMPKELTFDNVKDEIEKFIGSEIIFFIIPYSYNGNDGEVRPVDIYSLFEFYEPVQYSNSNTAEILKAFPELRNKNFQGRFVGFNSYKNNVFFDLSNERNVANILKKTMTRRGLAETLYRTLEKDQHDSGYAKELMLKITNYVNELQGNITTSGILKQVGVFSDKAYDSKLLDDKTVKKLETLVSSTSRNGRANISTAQLLFSLDELQGNKIFKTANLYEKTYAVNGMESFCVTYNPDDTFIGEFAKFYRPLMALGCLSKEDVERLKYLKDGNEILNVFSEIIIRENLVPVLQLSVRTYPKNDVVSAMLLSFVKGSTKTYVSKEEKTKEPKAEKLKGNSPKFFKYEKTNENRFTTLEEIPDEDLPF